MNGDLKSLTAETERLLKEKEALCNLAIKIMKLQQALYDAEN